MNDTDCRQDHFLLFIPHRLLSFQPQLTAIAMHAIGALQSAASVSTWLHVNRDLPSGGNPLLLQPTVHGLGTTVNRRLYPVSCKQAQTPLSLKVFFSDNRQAAAIG